MKIGFDNKKYVKIQSKKIKERFKLFDKLYLEVGGKLFDDSHAARILPGFKNDVKISMFQELKDDLEIIFCINAKDIEKNKTREEYGITYDNEIIKLINKSKNMGFSVNSVVVTLYNNQISVDKFIKKLNRNGIKTYIHTFTKGYPTDVDTIVSEEGYGKNPYIETTKPLILVPNRAFWPAAAAGSSGDGRARRSRRRQSETLRRRLVYVTAMGTCVRTGNRSRHPNF